MKKAILMLMNEIKKEQKALDFLTLANITTIYKNKGSRFDLENDHHIAWVHVN